jgi:hypothetical protein
MHTITSADGASIACDRTGTGPRWSWSAARRGLGHTEKLNSKVIAATLTEFLTDRLPSAAPTTGHDTVPRA